MPEAQKIPFLTLFSAWKPGGELAGIAEGLMVTRAVVDKAARSIRAEVECARAPEAPVKAMLERSLALAYRVERVELDRTEGSAAPPLPASEREQAAPPPLSRPTTPSPVPRRSGGRP